MIDLYEAFEKYNDDEFLKFERIEDKRASRPDLHAFLLLDELQPSNRDIVSAAGHDQIWLDIDTEELSKTISEDQILQLVRCGVMFDSDSLSMFA